MRAALLALCVTGCVCVVPDWNTRPMGLHQQHKPEFRAWTVPEINGEPGPVTMFARANHAPKEWDGAALEISWKSAKIILLPQRDMSWTFRGRFPEGHWRFTFRLLVHGKAVAESHRSVRLTVKPGGGTIDPAKL